MSRNDLQTGLSRAQHAQWEHAVYLGISVSVVNKARWNYSQAGNTGSIPVARSISLSKNKMRARSNPTATLSRKIQKL
jgi:hypothetical protein